MVRKISSQKVTAIVTAYNEAERIGGVLRVLSDHSVFSEIIVVDDGSSDVTQSVVARYPVRYVRHTRNFGKAQAMETGVRFATSEVIFFCDADISGLTHAIIDEIVRPVLHGQVEMFIAMRNRKVYFLKTLVAFVPLLGGERALTRRLWQSVPEHYKKRFRIETALNFYAKYYGAGFRYKLFPGLSQSIKERKYGIRIGLQQRMFLFYDVFVAIMRLQFTALPKNMKTMRLMFGSLFWSFLGIAAGIIILLVTNFGSEFWFVRFFSTQLRAIDSTVVQKLFSVARQLGRQTLSVVGWMILVTHGIVFLASLQRLLFLLRSAGMRFISLFTKAKILR